jgi:hypothetical protein
VVDDCRRPLPHRLRLVVPPLTVEQRRNHREVGCQLRVIRADGLQPDVGRSACEALAGYIFSAGVFEHAKLMEDGGNLRVFAAQRLLRDGERAMVETRGLVVGAGMTVVNREIVQGTRDVAARARRPAGGRDVAVLAAERLLGERERFLQHRLGLQMPAEGARDAGQPADRPDSQSLYLEVVRIVRLLEDVVRAAVISPGARVVGEVFTRTSEAQQHRDDVPVIRSALPFDETEGAYGEALGLDGPTALAEVGGDVQKPAGFLEPTHVLDTFREQVRSSPCPRLEQLQYPQRRRAAARIDRAE